MYGILVVDDESVVRIGFKTLIDWESLGFRVAGEARDGREALEMLAKRKIDVVVTDIRMPGMDGLDLIRALKAAGSETPVVVLSAFDGYPLVQQAFKLGVRDYLLKSDLRSDTIGPLFGELRRFLDGRPRAGGAEPGDAPGSAENPRDARRAFLRGLLEGGGRVPSPVPAGLRLGGGPHLAAAAMRIEDYRAIRGRYGGGSLPPLHETLENVAEEALSAAGMGELVPTREDGYCLLVRPDGAADPRAAVRAAAELGRKVSALAARYMNLTLSWGVSAASTGGLEEAPGLYRDAEDALAYVFLRGRGAVIPAGEVRGLKPARIPGGIHGMVETFRRTLASCDGADPSEALPGCLVENAPFDAEGFHDVRKLYGIYASLLAEHAEARDFPEKLKVRIEGLSEAAPGGGTLVELNDGLRGILAAVAGEARNASPLVRDARRFARDNYRFPISSQDAAAHLHVTKEHLCREFGRRTGESFMKHLMRVRIERAKELLARGDMKASRVAELVGIGDASYFFRLFRRMTGQTPGQYMAALGPRGPDPMPTPRSGDPPGWPAASPRGGA